MLKRWIAKNILGPLHNHEEGARDPWVPCDGCIDTVRLWHP